MKKINLLVFLFILLFVAESGKTFAQAWLPEPVRSPYLEAMSGTWISDPYTFMGSTNSNVVTYNMVLNGQFMEVKMKRTDDKGITMYEGIEIIKPGSDGSLSGSMFDVYGTSQNQTYSGKFEGGKILLTVSNPDGTGATDIIIDGGTMTQNVTFMMGKDTPKQNITVVYKKQ